ncbi:MAG: pilus assembly protein, partial [Bdellovibrionales bacterium]|nr:pilus assembly protein [Bdellovibrionales bacterium]
MIRHTPETTAPKRSAGQAMVEFVLILFLVMILCSGMLFAHRLLLFQFWAQQEARYIAFEQTWVPHWASVDPYSTPISDLSDGAFYHRPSSVERIQGDAEKDVSDDGDVTDLTGFWAKADEPSSPTKTMLASLRGEDMWYRRTGSLSDLDLSLVATAFASSPIDDMFHSSDSISLDPRENVDQPRDVRDQELGEKFTYLLERGGFGEKLCNAMEGFLARRGVSRGSSYFSDEECPAYFEREFGEQLGDNLDFPAIFRDFGYELDWGLEPHEALQVTVERAVAEQFYAMSAFDTAVKAAFLGAIPYITAGRLDVTPLPFAGKTLQMIGDARYLGSSVAVGLVNTQLSALVLGLPTSNADAEKALEDAANLILHHDAADFFGGYAPGVDNGFFLNPLYLPVPPYFGQVAGSLQSGLMKNVLAREGGSLFSAEDLIEPWVDNSNKLAEVDYFAGNGLFPAATKRWSGNRTLTSRFYLVTQPWHIRRRESPFGPFREKGDQYDDWDDVTEEAMLRRRVEGLWLFPSNIVALAEPITDLLPGELGGVMDGFEAIGSIIGDIKSFVLVDNPLFDILDFLSNIPGFGAFVPTIPKWPAVRPDAYPQSAEMTSNSSTALGSDQLMDEQRNFEDYIDEQLDNDPIAAPEF